MDSRFLSLLKLVNLDPKDYITRHDRCAYLDGIEVMADLYTIDKPKLIGDLGQDIVRLPGPGSGPISYASWKDDIVVDATGVARALGSPIYEADDMLSHTYQVKVRARVKYPQFFFHNKVGYSWIMPLTDSTAHIGCGALKGDREWVLTQVNNLVESATKSSAICACFSRIRLTGPILDTLVEGNTVHIGEAAGLVSPITGAGNVPAMISAHLLSTFLASISDYPKAVRERFSPLLDEAKFIKGLRRGDKPHLSSIPQLRGALNRAGFYPNLLELSKLVKKLRSIL